MRTKYIAAAVIAAYATFALPSCGSDLLKPGLGPKTCTRGYEEWTKNNCGTCHNDFREESPEEGLVGELVPVPKF